MKTFRTVLGRAVALCAATAGASEHSLQFKSLDFDEAMSFGGGYGMTAQLTLTRPAGIKREAKAISANPIYGQFSTSLISGGLLFRLDESKGTKKGYDSLVLDWNQNGDLTDDKAAPLSQTKSKQRLPENYQNARFGPIAVPETHRIGEWRPTYYADNTLYARDLDSVRRDRMSYIGYLRLKAGWCLETTAEFEGRKHKVAIYDANTNFKLGNGPASRVFNATNWYFTGGDNVLVDANDSGDYDTGMYGNEVCVLSPVVYHGAKPFSFSLAKDCKTLRVEPYSGALAEVRLQPKGEQVRVVYLGWERGRDQWEQLKVWSAGGKILVPEGSYRLYACEIKTEGAGDKLAQAKGFKRLAEPAVAFRTGRNNTLSCGAPLDVRVTAANNQSTAMVAAGKSLTSRISSALSTAERQPVLRINAVVVGRGGEIYSSYGMGLENDPPPKPSFTVLAANGKEIASGNLEFG